MKSLQNQCAQHMSKREELIKNYKEVNPNDLPFVLEIITHYPSYQAFQRLYTDLDENQYQLPLQLEFINAYNNGYIMASKVDTDIVFDRYESMFQELRNHKDKNKQKAKKLERQRY